jgi:hypothetical protein
MASFLGVLRCTFHVRDCCCCSVLCVEKEWNRRLLSFVANCPPGGDGSSGLVWSAEVVVHSGLHADKNDSKTIVVPMRRCETID